MSRLFNIGEAIELHCDQVNRYGGTSGVRHTGALRAAVGQRSHTGDAFALAAGYCLDFVAMRPFPDGNARVGLVAALVCLDLNGITCELSDEAVVEMVEQLRGRSVGAADLADFLRQGAGKPASRQTVMRPKPSEPAPDHPAEASAPAAAAVAEIAEAAAEAAAEEPAPPAEAAAEPPAGRSDGADLDQPAGPDAGTAKDRPTTVRELADALADLEDDDGDAKPAG